MFGINANIKTFKNTANFKIDTSIIEQQIENPSSICFNDCAISLSLNVLNINEVFFNNSTFIEFKNYLYSIKKIKYSKNELLSLQILLKYKSETSFSNSNGNLFFNNFNNNFNNNLNKNNENVEMNIDNNNSDSTFINNISMNNINNKNNQDNSITSSFFV
jgi:hypothetical protein